MRKPPSQGSNIPTLKAPKGSSTTYGKSSAESTLGGTLDFTKPPTFQVKKSSPLILQSGAAYISALGQDNLHSLEQGKQGQITTLVPDIPGKYQELMQKGEKAFRNGDFREAVFQFDLANIISINSPESLLSLMHTYFATAHGIYSLPSFYLRETLKRFPELALIHIHPKAFYGKGADYIRDIVRLENYVTKYPKNPNGQFLLGYIRWRDGKPKAAKKALEAALQYSHNKELTEAIHILWDGIVASGKASGALVQKKKPEKKTPAEKKAGITKDNAEEKKDGEKENRSDKPIRH